MLPGPGPTPSSCPDSAWYSLDPHPTWAQGWFPGYGSHHHATIYLPGEQGRGKHPLNPATTTPIVQSIGALGMLVLGMGSQLKVLHHFVGSRRAGRDTDPKKWGEPHQSTFEPLKHSLLQRQSCGPSLLGEGYECGRSWAGWGWGDRPWSRS